MEDTIAENKQAKIETAFKARAERVQGPTRWLDLLKTATTEGGIELEDKTRDLEAIFQSEDSRDKRSTVAFRSGRVVLVQGVDYDADGGIRSIIMLKILLDKPDHLKDILLAGKNYTPVPLVGCTAAEKDENGIMMPMSFNKLNKEELEEFTSTAKKMGLPYEPERLPEWNQEFEPAKQRLANKAA